MPRLHRILQALFGLLLLTFALMPILGWEPPPVRPRAEPMQAAVLGSGYVIPVILIVYLLVGASWLANRFAALGAVVLFPISLNILLFHSMLNRTSFGVAAALVLFSINVYMLVSRRGALRGLLQANS